MSQIAIAMIPSIINLVIKLIIVVAIIVGIVIIYKKIFPGYENKKNNKVEMYKNKENG